MLTERYAVKPGIALCPDCSSTQPAANHNCPHQLRSVRDSSRFSSKPVTATDTANSFLGLGRRNDARIHQRLLLGEWGNSDTADISVEFPRVTCRTTTADACTQLLPLVVLRADPAGSCKPLKKASGRASSTTHFSRLRPMPVSADATYHARSASIDDPRSGGSQQARPGCSSTRPAADHIAPDDFDASAADLSLLKND